MKRLIPSLVITILIIASILPIIMVPSQVYANPAIVGPKVIVPGNKGQRNYYMTVGAVSGNTAGFFFPKFPSPYYQVGAIVDSNLNGLLNGTVLAKKSYELTVATNDTGYLVFGVVQYNDDSDYDAIATFVKNDGTIAKTVMVEEGKGSLRSVAAAWGQDRWLVTFLNSSASNRILYIRTLDKQLNNISTATFQLSSSNVIGVGAFPFAYYDSINDVFVVLARNETGGTYDLVVLLIPRTNPDNYKVVVLDTGGSEGDYFGGYNDAYKYVIYRRSFMAPINGDDKFLIVFGVSGGPKDGYIEAAIIDVSDALADTPPTIIDVDTSGGDTYFYPWIAASSTEWMVVWTSNNVLSAMAIYPDGSHSSKMIIDASDAGYATVVYNEYDYTIVYRDYDGTYYNIVGVRIKPTGERSSFVNLVTNTGQFVDTVTVYLGNNITVVSFENTSASIDKVRVFLFNTKDIPEPTMIETELTVTLTKNTGADGYLNAGDTVTVSGTLTEKSSGNPVVGKTIKATLTRTVARQPGDGTLRETIDTQTTTTQSDGSYTITFTIPSNALSGIYQISVEFEGEMPYAPSNAKTDYFLVFHTAPSLPTWVNPPADIQTGPAKLIQNGQLIITDPVGDERTDNIAGSGEESDVDIKVLQVAFDKDFIYINATFEGDPSLTGSYAPVLGLAFDFTPENKNDGYRAGYNDNFWIAFYSPTDTDTKLQYKRGWDLTVTIGGYKTNVFYEDDGMYTAYLYIAHSAESGQFAKVQAGFFKYVGNSIIAAIPLDIVRYYNSNLSDTGIQPLMMFAAVFCEDLGSEALVEAPWSNWFDVPGALSGSTAYTPPSYLNQGYNESYTDYELDTKFIYYVDWDTPKIFGYTEVYITATNITTTGFGEQGFDGPRSFVGQVEYIARLRDANNTLFYIYGKTIELYVNGTSVTSTTTDAVGTAPLTYTWTASDWKHNHTIYVSFAGDSDYMASESTHYTVRTMYLINITSITYEFVDNDGDELITRGDQLKINATVVAWDGSNWVTAPDGIGVKFMLHSPDIYLGTGTTSGGVASIVYTFTGDEYLFGTHTIYAGGDGDTSWAAAYPGAPTTVAQQFSVVPLPEVPVMPIILLAVLLLFIVLKKRK